MISRTKEEELYGSVTLWLSRYLKGLNPRSEVSTYDTHSIQLSSLIVAQGLQSAFPDYSAYEIKVDVTGLIVAGSAVKLAFVECKIGPITLRDVGQLLGYSLVAQPEVSLLVSPRGLSDRLTTLLVTLGRTDILSYGGNRFLRTVSWNWDRAEIELSTLVPRGDYLRGAH